MSRFAIGIDPVCPAVEIDAGADYRAEKLGKGEGAISDFFGLGKETEEVGGLVRFSVRKWNWSWAGYPYFRSHKSNR